MTGNRQLAADLRARADELINQRRVLLVAAVALTESTSIEGAKRILREWTGPARIRNDAIELLSQLAEDVPAQGGAAQEGTTA